MKTLIVTASSKTKSITDETPYFFDKESTFAYTLDKTHRQKYFEARDHLLTQFKFKPGPDTDPSITPEGAVEYLPAYKRYTGRTFSKVSDRAWSNLIDSPEEYDCVILSAFYGLIRYNEPIRDYDIKQVTKMPSNQKIGKYWRDQGAADWLFNYIKNTEVDDVKFVLSTSYSDIIRKSTLMDRIEEELGLPADDRQFKEAGMKSMILRGEYINDLLLHNAN